jgi:hypothetical protein
MKFTKHLFLIFFVFLCINSSAQESSTLTINVETAGTLPSLMPSSKKNEITNLTLTGFLNGTDICYIREMAGCDFTGNSTEGKLSVLDLSKAQIVAGGEAYVRSGSIDYYSSLDSIGNYTFARCSELTSVTIPGSVKTIGVYAFARCSRLTSVTIPGSVTTIGRNAFDYCKGLTSITIPDGVTIISDFAFAKCSGLTSVNIPNSVITIDQGAFSDCTGLTSVTISDSVTTIGDYTFSNCSGLTSVTIPNGVTSIGNYAFARCSGLTSVTIPNSVTTMDEGAFSDCSGLTSITIPNSMTTIEGIVFTGCSGLTSLTIPDGVTTIGNEVFDSCSQIKQIYCEGTTPPVIYSKTFYGIYNTCELYVPKGSFTVYRADPYWGNFINIIERVTTSISDIESGKTNVYTENGSIIVKGGKLGDAIDVYSVSGSLLHKIKITEDIVRISVAPQSFYIVKMGKKTFKIAM